MAKKNLDYTYDEVNEAVGRIFNLDELYGLAYNQSEDSYTRLGSLAGQPVKQSLSDDYLTIHSKITAGLLDDAGNFTELDPNDWSQDIDGNAVSLDGTDGQVVIRYPKIYERFEYDAGTFKYYIATTDLNGFSVHPFFIKNGVEVDYRYLGAYEASMYDVSAASYVGGEGAASYNSADGDKMSSVSGVYAKTSETRAAFRDMAQNRNTGFCQQYFYAWDYISKMIGIEYADWNIQNYFTGITQLDGADWDTYNNYNPLVQCGASNSLATGSGEVTVTISDYPSSGSSVDVKVPRWRGLENFFGHIWKWLDGINIKNVEADGKSYAFVCAYQNKFNDDTETDYNNVADLPISDGYITEMQHEGLMLPIVLGGSSTTHFGDYYWSRFDDLADGFGTDWRVVRVGGPANYGARTGVFCVTASHDSSNSYSSIGARLCY